MYNHLGNAYLKIEDYSNAERELEKSLLAYGLVSVDSISSLNSIPSTIETLISLAKLEHGLYQESNNESHLAKAEEYIELASSCTQYQLENFGEHEAFHINNNARDLFDVAMALGYIRFSKSSTLDHFNTCFQATERVKGYNLLGAVHAAESQQYLDVPEAIIDAEYRFRIDITYLEGKKRELLLAETIETDTILSRIKNQLFDLHNEYELLKKDIKENHEEYYNLKYNFDFINTNDIQQELLTTNQSLVEFFVAESTIYM